MGKKIRKRHYSKKAGLPPGTPVHAGEKHAEEVRIRSIFYDADLCEELADIEPEKVYSTIISKGKTAWIDIVGVHDSEVIESIGKSFDLHPLLLEDIMHTDQRAKAEDYGHVLFITARMIGAVKEEDELSDEQVSFVLGEGFLLTFQERIGDVFEPLRQRLRNRTGRVRERGADYLAYALLDLISDQYVIELEEIGRCIDETEDRIFAKPDATTLPKVQENKRTLLRFAQAVVPLRDAILRAERAEFAQLKPETTRFLTDLSDHLNRTADMIETYRELNYGLRDAYMSGMSLKLNNIMRVLTIISTIFIPLTFLAGIYGMNFEHIPELAWRYGYYLVWGINVAIACGLLWFFYRRKWL